MVIVILISYEEHLHLKCNHLTDPLPSLCWFWTTVVSIMSAVLPTCLEKQESLLYSFRPPYSPDLNPAEELFSAVKYYLKEHDEILRAMRDPTPLIKSAFDNTSPEQCKGWINHSGINHN